MSQQSDGGQEEPSDEATDQSKWNVNDGIHHIFSLISEPVIFKSTKVGTPKLVHDFLFFYLIFQIIVSGINPALAYFWEKNFQSQRLVSIFGFLATILAPASDENSFIILFSILLSLIYLDLVITIICTAYFQENKCLPVTLCYVSHYLSLVVNVFIYPWSCSFCGEQIHNMIYGKTSVAFSFVVSVTWIYLTVRTMLFLLFTHGSISFHEMIFKIWRPRSIIRIYLFLGQYAFFSHALIRDGTISPIVLMVLSFLNLLLELMNVTWANSFNTQIFLIASASSFASSVVLLIWTKTDLDPKDAFWTCLFCLIVIIIFFPLYEKCVCTHVKNKLADENFADNVKTPFSAFNYLAFGYRIGDYHILNSYYSIDIMNKFPNSLDLNIFFARTSLVLRSSPIKFDDFYQRIIPQSGFHPERCIFVNSMIKIYDPTEYYEMTVELNELFSELIYSICTIYNTMLDEMTIYLPKLSLSFDSVYNKTIRMLVRYTYRFPSVSKYYVDLLDTLIPSKRHFFRAHSIDYVREDLSLFPGHLVDYYKSPHSFQTYSPAYVKPITESPPLLSTHTKKMNGPYQYMIEKWFVLFFIIVTLLLPLVVMVLMKYQNTKYSNRTTHIMNGFSLIISCYHTVSCLAPLAAYNSTDSFWEDKFEEFRMTFHNIITDVQGKIVHYTVGFGSHLAIDLDLLKTLPTLFDSSEYFPLLRGNYTDFHALVMATFYATDLLADDHVLNYTDPLIMMDEVSNMTGIILDNFYEMIDESPVFIRTYIHADTEILTTICLILLVALGILLVYMERLGKWKTGLFMMTFRDASKSALTRVINYYQKCKEYLLNPKRNYKVGKTKMFVIYICIIMMILSYIGMIVCVVLNQIFYECYKKQLDRTLTIFKSFSDASINISNIVIYEFQGDFFEIEKQVEYLIDGFTRFKDHGSKLCPLCSLSSIIKSKMGTGLTIETTIFNWISSVLFSSEIPEFMIRHQRDYYFNILYVLDEYEQTITTECFNILQKTKNTNLALIFVYVFLVVLFSICLSIYIYHADIPIRTMMKVLNKLPENALSLDTQQIMQNSNWNFTSHQFKFDPSYYDTALKIFPDAVIILDHKLVIMSHNDSANLIVGTDGDGQKLFQALSLELHPFENLKDLESSSSSEDYSTHSDNTSTSKKKKSHITEENQYSMLSSDFTDLINNFLFDERLKVVVKQITGSKDRQKYWFSLTILPFIGSSQFALIFRDIGEEIRQQKMLQQETEKHFDIINQILPKEIAKRLMQEQRSISMSVDNVAISFCDIVSFTPWCGSQTSESVVKTLGHMFEIFDEKISRYITLTKIKCIGDCYVAAAGVFGNNDICAQQMLEFGLDLLDGIEQVNADLGTSLQVRVGIAFGGPISAGVMGIHKPVFDVYGDLVGEANGMESSGMPMKVHISSKMYELVHDDDHIFEPKGDGTYFVTRKTSL